jgi:hypothetical protein
VPSYYCPGRLFHRISSTSLIGAAAANHRQSFRSLGSVLSVLIFMMELKNLILILGVGMHIASSITF